MEAKMTMDQTIKSDLEAKLREEIEFEPDDQSHFINISVSNGIVTLNGAVPNYFDRVLILKTLENEKDVLGWINNVVIKLPTNMSRTDTEIAEAARDAIAETTTVPSNSVKVTVRDGWLYLEGAVEHCCQRDAAEYAVQCLIGVMGVINFIWVRNDVPTMA
jgi:osmotically-inducible protein OsmY